MLLISVLNNIEYKTIAGDINKEISSVEQDSRVVKEGALFVCVKGFTVDGHTFIEAAAGKGAAQRGRKALYRRAYREGREAALFFERNILIPPAAVQRITEFITIIPIQN